MLGDPSLHPDDEQGESRPRVLSYLSKLANCSGGMIASPIPGFDENLVEVEDMHEEKSEEDEMGLSLSESECSILGIRGSQLVRCPSS